MIACDSLSDVSFCLLFMQMEIEVEDFNEQKPCVCVAF